MITENLLVNVIKLNQYDQMVQSKTDNFKRILTIAKSTSVEAVKFDHFGAESNK